LCTKAADPALAAIPVVILSGAVRHPCALPAGVMAIVPKPFDVEDLLALVRRFAGAPER
jgi:CheY-like chemotaxis protein